jgi:ribonuclease-3
MNSEPDPVPTSPEPAEREPAGGGTGRRFEAIQAFLDRLGLDGLRAESFEQAFTHRSYAFEHAGVPDNERLEFLGDAVLGAAAAEFLYERFPNASEGELSKMKAFLVSRRELGQRARDLGMDALLLLGRGEDSSGGRERHSVVGSALEAFVGALFLMRENEALKRLTVERVLEPGVSLLERHSHPDYKSRLQELVQKLQKETPRYHVVSQDGPAHSRSFVVEVWVGDRALARGEGQRIKSAENQAAQEAWRKLSGDNE